ncbi:MAG: hypothetical protein M1818_003233 [Claussenomyces sp. TS43310]|nr:MAG: hypothetical protein M1818_003233 [Claussenomyces sp. TS43310]
MNLQRKFGKLTIKSAGHEAKVQVVLNDFEEADKVLTRLIDATQAWRDAWKSILGVQLGIVTAYEELYNPIVGASEGHTRDPVITPQQQLQRTSKLKQAYAELKDDLLEEVNLLDARIIKPAQDAKDNIKPLKKVIKKYDDKRLDFERYQDRVLHAQKKQKMSERDEASLAKAKEDLSKASDVRAFQVADTHIRETLPPIISATFSLLPHLLAVQIMTQNTILAQYYTILHTYCEEEQFPSPPPSMEDVVAQWNADFKPIQSEVESTTLLARGKAVHTPMHLGDNPRQSSITGLNIRGNVLSRRSSSQSALQASTKHPMPTNENSRQLRIPGSASTPSSAIPQGGQYQVEDEEEETPSSQPSRPVVSRQHSSGGPTRDYFNAQFSNGSTPSASSHLSPAYAPPRLSPSVNSIEGKKKPPPPPPKPKRIRSSQDILYVTAIYSFDGQAAGDLTFMEGDRIKIFKKTESTDDWWEGELRGVRGSFPANYCEMAS